MVDRCDTGRHSSFSIFIFLGIPHFLFSTSVFDVSYGIPGRNEREWELVPKAWIVIGIRYSIAETSEAENSQWVVYTLSRRYLKALGSQAWILWGGPASHFFLLWCRRGKLLRAERETSNLSGWPKFNEIFFVALKPFRYPAQHPGELYFSPRRPSICLIHPGAWRDSSQATSRDEKIILFSLDFIWLLWWKWSNLKRWPEGCGFESLWNIIRWNIGILYSQFSVFLYIKGRFSD